MSDEIKYTEAQLNAAKTQAIEEYKQSLGKIYVQEDVDNIVEKAKTGELTRFKESDEYKDLLALKDSDVSAKYEEVNNQNKELVSTNEQLKNEKDNLTTQMALIGKGVNAEDIKYVMVDLKENEIDINDGEKLDGYLKESKFVGGSNARMFDDQENASQPAEYNGIFAGKDD